MTQLFRVGELKEEDGGTDIQRNPGTLSKINGLEGSQILNGRLDGSQIQIDSLNDSQILHSHLSNGNEYSSQRNLFSSQNSKEFGILWLAVRI